MLVDLSMPLSPKTVPVPAHPEPTFTPLHLLERDGLRNTVMSLSLHTATHIDAPSHFIADGAAIDEIAIDRLHRPGLRLDLTGSEPGSQIGLQELTTAGFDAAASRESILMLATGWTDRGSRRRSCTAGTRPRPRCRRSDAAAAPSAIGLDFAVDRGKPFPNHVLLLGADVLLIENLMRLPELPPDGFTVSAFPIRIVGENGAPVRVVAELSG